MTSDQHPAPAIQAEFSALFTSDVQRGGAVRRDGPSYPELSLLYSAPLVRDRPDLVWRESFSLPVHRHAASRPPGVVMDQDHTALTGLIQLKTMGKGRGLLLPPGDLQAVSV